MNGMKHNPISANLQSNTRARMTVIRTLNRTETKSPKSSKMSVFNCVVSMESLVNKEPTSMINTMIACSASNLFIDKDIAYYLFLLLNSELIFFIAVVPSKRKCSFSIGLKQTPMVMKRIKSSS